MDRTDRQWTGAQISRAALETDYSVPASIRTRDRNCDRVGGVNGRTGERPFGDLKENGATEADDRVQAHWHALMRWFYGELYDHQTSRPTTEHWKRTLQCICFISCYNTTRNFWIRWIWDEVNSQLINNKIGYRAFSHWRHIYCGAAAWPSLITSNRWQRKQQQGVELCLDVDSVAKGR